MIQHVYESARKARGLNRVLVATDDRRILNTVEGFGGEVMLTSRRHPSGTDRLAEVARKIKADMDLERAGRFALCPPSNDRPDSEAALSRPLSSHGNGQDSHLSAGRMVQS